MRRPKVIVVRREDEPLFESGKFCAYYADGRPLFMCSHSVELLKERVRSVETVSKWVYEFTGREEIENGENQ